MSKVKFILQTVSGAFGVSDEIPWGSAREETFPTLARAWAAMSCACDEMLDRCGAGAWDSHRRVVPVRDTTATYNLCCMGTIERGGSGACPDRAEVAVTMPWPAGEPQPQPVVPDGWADICECGRCAERNAEIRTRLYAEFDREERERHA